MSLTGRYPALSRRFDRRTATPDFGSSIGRWPGWTSLLRNPNTGIRRSPTPSERFLNRELSWLEFNARVLALAEDRPPPAARAGEVPRHLQPEPRRVLPGAGVGPDGAARRRACAPPPPDGLDQVDQLRAIRGAGRRARRPAGGGVRQGDRSRRSTTRASASPTGTTSPADDRRSARRDVRRVDLPGAHPARGRPRAPVPVHLEPVAQPRGHRARPVERRRALRARQGAAAAPPLRRRSPTASASCSLEQVIAAQPRRAVPRHGGARAPSVPRHPRRRLRARGRSRGPARGDRVGAAAAQQVRPGRAARGRRQDDRRGARAALPRARARRRTTST